MGAGNQSGSLQVAEIMTRPALTVPVTATAREALDLMRQAQIAHLVVVDARGRVEGVLTDGDLRAAQPSRMLIPDQATREKALTLVRVRDVMSAHPYTVTPEMPAHAVIEKMIETKVGSIPVLDAQQCAVGIVTGYDVLRLAARLLEGRG